jgi:hypothetical protein
MIASLPERNRAVAAPAPLPCDGEFFEILHERLPEVVVRALGAGARLRKTASFAGRLHGSRASGFQTSP